MLQDLQLAGLSERSQEVYLRAVRQLATYFHTPPDRLSEQKVRDYFLHLKNDRKFASASLGITVHNGAIFVLSTTKEPAAPLTLWCPACGGPLRILGFLLTRAPALFDTS